MTEQNLTNILFVQDSAPCIRTIKLATALKENGYKIYIAFRGKTPNQVYGYGNDSFVKLIQLPKFSFRDITFLKKIIKDENIQLAHFHNEPDKLGAKLISAKLKVPIIYDQHDFMSFKKKLNSKEKSDERICNEEADGNVYITETYKNEVAEYYKLNNNSICFGNYFPQKSTLAKNNFNNKLSKIDNKKHVVYLGRISEHKNDHRNILGNLEEIASQDFTIHVYPSKDKDYKLFKNIRNVVIHNKLQYNKLINEISQYDFGLTIFNDQVASKLPHIRYAMGNKTYDYLCAGIPVLVQECLDEPRNFVINNKFGFILENYDEYKNLSEEEYSVLVERIIENRDEFTMEKQIQRVIEFYEKTIKKFHAKA